MNTLQELFNLVLAQVRSSKTEIRNLAASTLVFETPALQTPLPTSLDLPPGSEKPYVGLQLQLSSTWESSQSQKGVRSNKVILAAEVGAGAGSWLDPVQSPDLQNLWV